MISPWRFAGVSVKIPAMLANPYTEAKFLKSAASSKQLPEDTGYEVAFAGRSNAGKSSALNCLTGIRQLARTSKTPGRTQLLNVFTLGDSDRRLLDLPGYGYAKVSIARKQEWQTSLATYLETRKSLKGLVLLMDIRHPLKPLDQSMVEWAVHEELPVHIVLTKADKLSRGQTNAHLLQVKKYYQHFPDLISVQIFSSLKKQGVDDLIQVLNHWLAL
jgi:GTP-binding protein